MEQHVYEKNDLSHRLDGILGKTFGEIDNKGMFEHVQDFHLQKGIAGTIIERCVLGYDPDTRQEADLIVIEDGEQVKTELKTTGMVLNKKGSEHYVAKEPMTITAVGIYDLAEQSFETSHFWNKLEHMLIVYYHYNVKGKVRPYEYRKFPIKGYEFHEFTEAEKEALANDWKYVHALVKGIVSRYPGPKTREWKERVKNEYIREKTVLRKNLSYIDLAPQFPPRFRLKQSLVSTMVANHFGYELEQLPGRYIVISDIDRKCKELTHQYAGRTIGELAELFGISIISDRGHKNKGITEQIAIAMFGGTSKKMNQIELFQRFGLIAKSIVLTDEGKKTEDMKLFHIDFAEMMRKKIIDEDRNERAVQFEDSELYSYFSGHEFLCIIYKEPEKEFGHDFVHGRRIEVEHTLSMNTFVGFRRIVFSEEFINDRVKKVWDDTRDKILNGRLVDVVQRNKDGKIKYLKNGEISSAPNFLKSKENDVFIRGSAKDSSSANKTECVNGIKMLPQYIWIRGSAVIGELEKEGTLF